MAIMRETWFERLTGFPETTPEDVRLRLSISGTTLTSHVNGGSWTCGTLEVVKLADLRRRVASDGDGAPIRVSEQVADVQGLHRDRANAGAVFQVASQFNLLEMIGPGVTPERGVGIYENDRTQGPACAVAAGAGTIFRNYFAETHGRIGQTADNQIDCLAALGAALGNEGDRLWSMRNGYALATMEGLEAINRRLLGAEPEELDALRGELEIGIQWDTQVTLPGCSHLVTQVYCSALPVAYSGQPGELWEPFAILVLEAAYEATFRVAILNAERTGDSRLFLTLLGGGAFGNRSRWILDAMERAIATFSNSGLDVRVVSYGTANPDLRRLVTA